MSSMSARRRQPQRLRRDWPDLLLQTVTSQLPTADELPAFAVVCAARARRKSEVTGGHVDPQEAAQPQANTTMGPSAAAPVVAVPAKSASAAPWEAPAAGAFPSPWGPAFIETLAPETVSDEELDHFFCVTLVECIEQRWPTPGDALESALTDLACFRARAQTILRGQWRSRFLDGATCVDRDVAQLALHHAL